jgi:hypothetical protein
LEATGGYLEATGGYLEATGVFGYLGILVFRLCGGYAEAIWRVFVYLG